MLRSLLTPAGPAALPRSGPAAAVAAGFFPPAPMPTLLPPAAAAAALLAAGLLPAAAVLTVLPAAAAFAPAALGDRGGPGILEGTLETTGARNTTFLSGEGGRGRSDTAFEPSPAAAAAEGDGLRAAAAAASACLAADLAACHSSRACFLGEGLGLLGGADAPSGAASLSPVGVLLLPRLGEAAGSCCCGCAGTAKVNASASGTAASAASGADGASLSRVGVLLLPRLGNAAGSCCCCSCCAGTASVGASAAAAAAAASSCCCWVGCSAASVGAAASASASAAASAAPAAAAGPSAVSVGPMVPSKRGAAGTLLLGRLAIAPAQQHPMRAAAVGRPGFLHVQMVSRHTWCLCARSMWSMSAEPAMMDGHLQGLNPSLTCK